MHTLYCAPRAAKRRQRQGPGRQSWPPHLERHAAQHKVAQLALHDAPLRLGQARPAAAGHATAGQGLAEKDRRAQRYRRVAGRVMRGLLDESRASSWDDGHSVSVRCAGRSPAAFLEHT